MVIIDEYINLLKANKNLILTGAPGTGKSFLAKRIAEKMGAETEFVQFHPSYDYTDFVEGLRPISSHRKKDIGFKRIDGIFKDFCKKAIITNLPLVASATATIPTTISASIVPYTNNSSFHNLYEELKRRIKTSSVTLYTVYPRTPMDIKIDGIDIMYRKGGHFEYINKEYVYKIYCHYKDLNISDITKETFDDFVKIIGHTLNYTYYRGIVQELLNMTTQKTIVQESRSNIYHSDPSITLHFTDKPFVFIIDEINRGEISKIFGELFFSIDPGYRGKKGKVKTQYQNLITDENDPFKDGFYIPENVYIIGTMNDIDRSVESMD
ncbi:MAG: AAA family ATPase, partial [Duncaniella sp.]|nr:AAA family ATPase [Duncaniella sp.]